MHDELDTPAPEAHVAYASPTEPATMPVDAPVSTMANLVFVTTGDVACQVLGEYPTQISLTPAVAYRMAELLGLVVQLPDLLSRSAAVEDWNAAEAVAIPHGRVLVDELAVRIGIEPIGAGCYVAVMWEHVPALIFQLDWVARTLLAQTANR